jgi:hypothetical protein
MTSISNFETNVYSEELVMVTEEEFDSVMQLMAEDGDGFEGYCEWSAALESAPAIVAESENFIAYEDGKVMHRPEPKSSGRIGGIEI